jgi:hypothetical protein
MGLVIETDQVKELVSAAIMQGITTDQRNILIKSAIEYLITPPKKENFYGRDPVSPLQEAFNNGIYTAAQVIAREVVASDPAVQEKIRALLNDALVNVFETHREQTIDSLASAITAGLAYRGRD